MPTRKQRPHPRSLDVLFPKVRVKRCFRGHTQTPEWKALHGCQACRKEGELRAIAELNREQSSKAERDAWYRANPVPHVLEWRETSSGKLTRFAIPRHLQRRGPRRRRRI
jgi:hypothetical protein